MLIFVLAFSLHVIAAESKEPCLARSTCESCALYPSCFWCGSYAEGSCYELHYAKAAQYECYHQWVNGGCAAGRNEEAKKKLDQMLDILNGMKKTETANKEPDVFQSMLHQTEKKETTNADLKELLHKLLLLKLLKKVKTSDSTLTDEDQLLLTQLTGKKAMLITTMAPTSSINVNDELSELLALLKNKEAASLTTASETLTPVTTDIIAMPSKTTKIKPTTRAAIRGSLIIPNHVENGNVTYVEAALESLSIATTKKNTASRMVGSTVKGGDNGYCNLYEEMNYCNSDQNCTWCNTFDNCIGRNDEAYKTCVGNKENILDEKYGLDRCLAMKRCKQCVGDEKCYWCDVSKSCHTYPFFGYVPQSCGGDWYYKQCDVQLAVVIIVLPLIIILLAMVTFYFCLKYCYYRRKVLRVPLFERPGVFDYRKDKKVYFVNPEDEGSEDELATEKIRKKYRLPLERAPLIDPNS